MNVGAAVTDDGRYLLIYQTRGLEPEQPALDQRP